MSRESLEELAAARLRECAQEKGKARRLRLRQLEMWLRHKHGRHVSLAQLTEWLEAGEKVEP